jgi:hypothetical protein
VRLTCSKDREGVPFDTISERRYVSPQLRTGPGSLVILSRKDPSLLAQSRYSLRVFQRVLDIGLRVGTAIDHRCCP